MTKILLVEDDTDIAELERDYLEASGFSVDISSDGDEGQRMALTGDYQLVLLDVMLPGADGFAICRAVRKELDIPILMVSARLEDIDKIRAALKKQRPETLILCTEKDAERLRTTPLFPAEWHARTYALPIEATFLFGASSRFDEFVIRHVETIEKSHILRR